VTPRGNENIVTRGRLRPYPVRALRDGQRYSRAGVRPRDGYSWSTNSANLGWSSPTSLEPKARSTILRLHIMCYLLVRLSIGVESRIHGRGRATAPRFDSRTGDILKETYVHNHFGG
jgi:hypothetical protein